MIKKEFICPIFDQVVWLNWLEYRVLIYDKISLLQKRKFFF